jgi:hypothetical protein
MAELRAVAQYQIVQRPDRLDVAVIARDGAAATDTCRDVERALGDQLDRLGVVATQVVVQHVERLEREPAGKLKLIKRASPDRAQPDDVRRRRAAADQRSEGRTEDND